MATDNDHDNDHAMPDHDGDEAQAKGKSDLELQLALKTIVGRLAKDAEERVSKRRVVENRWIDDLRQYNGVYDKTTESNLAQTPNKSSLFVNATRPKTNACEAKISDMLFPTDDRNWGIQPMPVPHLSAAAKKAVDSAHKLIGQANEAQEAGDPNHHAIAQQAQDHATQATDIQAQLEEAKVRAQAMQDEMETQLGDCQYQQQCRDMLMDAAKLGTGIMKGPVANEGMARRQWEEKRHPETGESLGWGLSCADDVQPAFYRVDPWSFFPDPDARTIVESDSTYERHLCTKGELRSLAQQPGFDADAIRRLLRGTASDELPTYLSDLRSITAENQAPQDKRYQVWEYRGSLTAEEMLDLCDCMGKTDLAEDSGAYEADPLDEVQVVLWFCQDEVLKFGINHLDSGESIYSVFCLEKDDSSIWGFGVPYWMRDTQKALCAAWRMLMDNAGLSTGPQIVIDTSVIEPFDGKWELAARKLWKRKGNAKPGEPGITMTDIPSNINDLLVIVKQCEAFMEDESSVTATVMGDAGTTVQTARGTAMLANAANVTFRRIIKNFDDDMTTPNIRRLYDWNMQFSDKDYIKGDMQVDARGTSVLLVRELQSQNLTELLGMLPPGQVGGWLKGPQLLRKTVQSMMLPADEVVESDDDIKSAQQAAAANPPPPNETQMKMDGAMKVAQERVQGAITVAQINAQARAEDATTRRDAVLSTVAQNHNMQNDRLMVSQNAAHEDRQSKERILAAEAALAQRKGSGVPL